MVQEGTLASIGDEQPIIDVKFLRSIFDTSKVIENPTSPRKIRFFGVLFALALAAVGIIYAFHDHFEDSFNTSSQTRFAIAIVTFALEPFILLLLTVILLYCPPEPKPVTKCGREYNRGIGVIIPCHKSHNEIVATLKACLRHFDEQQIYIVDNSDNPPDQEMMRQKLLEEKFHCVNYIFQPIGNKTLALYTGAIAAKDYYTLLIVDDDVRLLESMEFDTSLLTENTKAVSYSIRAVYPGDDKRQSRFSWIVEFQDLEYKLCDFVKMFQSRFSTVTFPHGAISLWDRNTLIECLRAHDTVFYGEDIKVSHMLYNQAEHGALIFKTDKIPAFLVCFRWDYGFRKTDTKCAMTIASKSRRKHRRLGKNSTNNGVSCSF